MTATTGRGPLLLAAAVGAGAVGLIALALLPAPAPPAPSASPSASATPSTSPSASASPSASPSASADPALVAAAALAGYQERLSRDGGVDLALIDAAGSPVTMSMDPAGNYRASTTDPLGPEWVLSDGVLYGRLGNDERERHQATFEALGKPDAAWTSAAVSAAAQRRLLATADIASVVSDLLPLMESLSAEDVTGLTITGVVPAERSAALLASYAFDSPPPTPEATPSVTPTATAPAVRSGVPVRVTLLIDPEGALRGYRVALPGSRAVESTVRQFARASITAPDPDSVITLEDLDRAAALASSAAATPTASATPTETASQSPSPRSSASARPRPSATRSAR